MDVAGVLHTAAAGKDPLGLLMSLQQQNLAAAAVGAAGVPALPLGGVDPLQMMLANVAEMTR